MALQTVHDLLIDKEHMVKDGRIGEGKLKREAFVKQYSLKEA